MAKIGSAIIILLVILWGPDAPPKIAQVGLYESNAKKNGIPVDTFTTELSRADRAIPDGETEGFVRLHVRKGADQILGATVIAAHAGDLISEITLAMTHRLGLKKIAGTLHP